MPEPVELPSYDVFTLPQFGGSVQLRPHGHAEAGKIYPASDGERFFYNTAGDFCHYVLVNEAPGHTGKLGKVFCQTRNSFSLALSTGHADLLKVKLAATQNVIKNFLDVYLGCMATAGGPVAWSITGMKAVVTAGHIKQNYDTYIKSIEAIHFYMVHCAPKTPTLAARVFDQLLWGAIEQRLVGRSKELISGAIPGPKVAGKLVGVLLGAVGENKVVERLRAVRSLLVEVLNKVATHCLERHPEKLSKDQVEALARHVIKQLTPVGQAPTQQSAENIIREINQHALFVRKPLKDISDALAFLAA